MTWLKRKNRLPRQLALGRLEDAMGRADQYRYLRTRSGRTAHLEPLERPGSGALCGWAGAEVEVQSWSFPICRLCEVEAGIGSEGRAAS